MNHEIEPEDLGKRPPSAERPIDLSGLVFSPWRGQIEFDEILKCRWRGYRKYGYTSPDDCLDNFDDLAIHYFCKDCQSGEIVGSLRMLSKLDSKLELEAFVDISDWAIDGIQPAELTRFSVPISKRSAAIKFGLWKLAWADAVSRGHTHFIIWTRREAKRNYDLLGFDFFLGQEQTFCHPLLGGYPHVLMTLDIIKAREDYRANRPSFYEFFCKKIHPEIVLG